MPHAPTGRVTIHDVAKHAQVSTSTVSLVLNGKLERMRDETRERVLRAVAELGYSTNQMARALKTGLVPTIGLVVPTVANPFWGEFARCVEHAATAKNYQVLLCNAERVPEREQRYVESMFARGIRGVLLGTSPLSLEHLRDVTRRGLQVVVFDRTGKEGLTFDSVCVNNVLGAKLATTHLLELGHRRIGFVSGSLSSANRNERFEGYRATLAIAGIRLDPKLIWMENVSPSDGEEEVAEIGRVAALSLLSRSEESERPTALFAMNDMTAIGLYAGLRELGLRVPQEVSVIGFDDIHLCRSMAPQLTTVRQPMEPLANTAVAGLIDRMEGRKGPMPTYVTLAPELMIRGSTAAPKGQ